jgi:hypothetical protein
MNINKMNMVRIYIDLNEIGLSWDYSTLGMQSVQSGTFGDVPNVEPENGWDDWLQNEMNAIYRKIRIGKQFTPKGFNVTLSSSVDDYGYSVIQIFSDSSADLIEFVAYFGIKII